MKKSIIIVSILYPFSLFANEKSFITLTKDETYFVIFSFLGISFTILIIIFYFLSKKRWLITRDILEKEIKDKTATLSLQNEKLKQIHKRMVEQSNKDVLTNIYNRKFFNEKLDELLSLHNRYSYKFSFLIFDIDNFKSINDTYGHIIGDKVLVDLTSLVSLYIRSNDYFFRIGGEEFVILLSQTTFEKAQNVANKIRLIIEKDLKSLENKKITVSIGLTQVKQEDSVQSIYKRADDLLYKAKEQGKNRVEIDN